MSIRSTTHFKYGDRTVAIVYRHSDGYPSEAGRDLVSFIKYLRESPFDSRIGDPSYLASKYVVFLASMFACRETEIEHVDEHAKAFRESTEFWAKNVKPHESQYDFISVGIMAKDPDDIEYRYEVDEKGGVRVFERGGEWQNPVWVDITDSPDTQADMFKTKHEEGV